MLVVCYLSIYNHTVMKLQVSAILLIALVAIACALPQQQQGPRRQQQQGARRRPAQGAAGGNRSAVPDTQRTLGPDGKPVPLHLDPNLTLSKISQTDLDAFLASAEAVNELVTCFENLRKCKARSGISLVRDVRSLGRGGVCKTCDKNERKHTRDLVGKAIAGLQQNHPIEWRRLLPEIGFLL